MTNQISELPVQQSIHFFQKKINDIHEEIYKKGGIKPVNAAIDELSKLIFLKIHTEIYPDYVIQQFNGQGRKFTEIFHAPFIQEQGKKAVRDLQDAFQEISRLPCYSYDRDNEHQTMFPYQEHLRLENPDVLSQVITMLSSLSLSQPDKHFFQNGTTKQDQDTVAHLDILGYAYDVFLRGKYDNAGGLGTYLTPNDVVDCMVEIAFSHISDAQLWAKRGDPNEIERWNPQELERDLPAFFIGDICCGTGRFLVKSLVKFRERILNTPHKSNQEKIDWLSKAKQYCFFGADQSPSSILKARINFLLFGETQAQLFAVDDSILDHRIDHLAGTFDLLLTNPPFGEGKYDSHLGLEKMRRLDLGLALGWQWKDDETKKKPLLRADPAMLFIDRNLQLLKPNGILCIILPDGVLESAYAYVHRYLLDKAMVKAVISLPKETFAIAGTVAKTSMLCVQKKGADNADNSNHSPVFMAVADHVGLLKKGNIQVQDPKGNDLLKISETYTNICVSQSSSVKELSLLPMMVMVHPAELEDTLTAHTYHIDRLRAKHLVSRLNGHSQLLHDVVSLVKPELASRTDTTLFFISVLHVDQKSNVDWDEAQRYTPVSKGLCCYPNNIIFSCLNPSKIRVAVVPEDVQGEVLCSTEFAVLQVKEGEDPYFVALALKTSLAQRQIVPLSRGTSSSRRRIHQNALLAISIPYPDSTIRQKVATQFFNALEEARTALTLNNNSFSVLEQYVDTLSVG